MNTFWKRFISGTVILIITVVLGIVGGPVLGVAMCAISCIAYVEYTNATKVREPGHRFNILQAFGLLTIVAYYGAMLLTDDMYCPDEIREWFFHKSVGTFNMFTVLILLILVNILPNSGKKVKDKK